MREEFRGYDPPTNDEFERLWKDAIIAFDANVLLNVYRYPTSAAEKRRPCA